MKQEVRDEIKYDPNGKLKITYLKIEEIEKQYRNKLLAIDFYIIDEKAIIKDR